MGQETKFTESTFKWHKNGLNCNDDGILSETTLSFNLSPKGWGNVTKQKRRRRYKGRTSKTILDLLSVKWRRIKRHNSKKRTETTNCPIECFNIKLMAYLKPKYLNERHNNQYLSSRNLTTCLLKFNGTVLLNHRLKPMNRPIAVNILRRRVCSKTEMTWSR